MASGIQEGATHVRFAYADLGPAFPWTGSTVLPVVNESTSLAQWAKVFVGSNVELTHVLIARSWEEAYEIYLETLGPSIKIDDDTTALLWAEAEADQIPDDCTWVDGVGLCDDTYVMLHEIPVEPLTWLYRKVA